MPEHQRKLLTEQIDQPTGHLEQSEIRQVCEPLVALVKRAHKLQQSLPGKSVTFCHRRKVAPALIGQHHGVVCPGPGPARSIYISLCLFLFLQACRGFTITLAFIDEANFINPKNYPSVLAYAISSDCKLIFCSSINTQSGDKHNLLRRWANIPGVNYVELTYVCPKHVGCVKFFPGSVRCPCRSLYTPAHVDVSAVDKAVSNRMVEDSYLHEIAGGVERADNAALDSHKTFNDQDLMFVKTVPFDACHVVACQEGLRVYVYVDPSFQTSSLSGTAVAAVCRVNDRTVVLAAEHYFLPDSECGNWCQNVSRLVVGLLRFVSMAHRGQAGQDNRYYVIAEANLSADAVALLCKDIKAQAAQYVARSPVLFYHRRKKASSGQQATYQLGFYLEYHRKNDIFKYFVEEVKCHRFMLSSGLVSSTVQDLDVRHYVAEQLALLVCERRHAKGGKGTASYTGKNEGKSDDLLVALACATFLARHRPDRSANGDWLWE